MRSTEVRLLALTAASRLTSARFQQRIVEERTSAAKPAGYAVVASINMELRLMLLDGVVECLRRPSPGINAWGIYRPFLATYCLKAAHIGY